MRKKRLQGETIGPVFIDGDPKILQLLGIHVQSRPLAHTWFFFIESRSHKIPGFRKYFLYPCAQTVKMPNYGENVVPVSRKIVVHTPPGSH